MKNPMSRNNMSTARADVVDQDDRSFYVTNNSIDFLEVLAIPPPAFA
jgi:hypothetical protein